MSTSTYAKSKRIAKNTMLLYVRMLFTMVLALFTSRIVLNGLGVADFGIYNVVGGFIAMFTVLSGSFSNAITRFITYELGQKDSSKLNLVFCTAVNIQLLMSLVVIVFAEVVGLWFLNYHMKIPPDRFHAAHWVLQCAIGVFVLNMIRVPYQAEIIAHEHMGAFATITIADKVLQLVIAYLLYISPIDRLIMYSLLFLFESLLIRIVFGVYCDRRYDECKYHLLFDKSLFVDMGKFAGYNFMGSSTFMLNTQGVNMLMNIYFGVVANAARAIAVQVDLAVRSFANSFTMAINPQITKSYSGGEMDYMYKLVCRGARFSSFLFLFFAVPIVLEAPVILKIWLKIVPEYTVIFVRLIVFSSFVDTILGNSFWTAIMATGNIKNYQIAVSIVGILVFPLSWLCFKLGYGPQSTYIVYMIIYCIVFGVRLYYMKVLLNFPFSMFIKDVVAKACPVGVLAFLLPLPLLYVLDAGFVRLIVVSSSSFVLTSILIYSIGVMKGERQMLLSKVQETLNKVR